MPHIKKGRMLFIRHKQRPFTAVSPHSGNARALVPKRPVVIPPVP